MSKKFDSCEFCCAWAHSAEMLGPTAVCESYPAMMRKVLKHLFHMPKKAANHFIDDACCGNWDRMHLTRAEQQIDANGWSGYLLSEVTYFSDRWTWDRVMRAQWIYKRLCDALKDANGYGLES